MPSPIDPRAFRTSLPPELTSRDQWVVWRHAQRRVAGVPTHETTKLPISPRTGGVASTSDPTTWASLDRALRCVHERGGDGVGFVFTADDPLVGVDLDDCRDPATGTLAPWAARVVELLESYTEVSPSGAGVHVIARASLTGGGRKRGPVEVYDRGRYFTVTAERVTGTPPAVMERTEALRDLLAKLNRAERSPLGAALAINGLSASAPPALPSSPQPALPSLPRPVLPGSETLPPADQTLLARILGDHRGERVATLWRGDWQALYPSQSEADLALCSILAYYTGVDVDRVDRLFRHSGLYRPKWDERHHADGRTYGEGTLGQVLLSAIERHNAAAESNKSHVRYIVVGPGSPEAPPDAPGANKTTSRDPNKSDFLDIVAGGGSSGAPPAVPRAPAPGGASGWAAPIPFTTGAALPAFPTDTLPGVLRAQVEAIAEATQTPPDLAAMLALSVIAAAVATRAVVRVSQGYVEPLNLWTVTAMEPGTRKSAVFAAMAAPLAEHELAETRRSAATIAAAVSRHKILETALRLAQDGAARAPAAERAERERDAIQLAAELEAHVVPGKPRVIVDDCTPEKLIGLLAENGGRMGIFSPEGDLFSLLAGRNSGGGDPNLDVYLKGHIGDTLRVDRVHRAGSHVHGPALTIGITLQPNLVHRLAATPEFRERGLVARFLYAVPPSLLGYRRTGTPPVPDEVDDAYRGLVARLLALPEAPPDPAAARRGVPIPLDEDARACFHQFADWLEPQLRPGESLGGIKDWSSKLAGSVARIAGLLHLAAHAAAGDARRGLSEPITVSTVQAATRVGQYCIEHAFAAYALMGTDPTIDDAQIILKWLCARAANNPNAPLIVSRAETWRRFSRLVHRPARLDAVLTVLIERNYLRLLPAAPQLGSGRPLSPVFAINPRALPRFRTAAPDTPDSAAERLTLPRFPTAAPDTPDSADERLTLPRFPTAAPDTPDSAAQRLAQSSAHPDSSEPGHLL